MSFFGAVGFSEPFRLGARQKCPASAEAGLVQGAVRPLAHFRSDALRTPAEIFSGWASPTLSHSGILAVLCHVGPF